MVPKLFVFPKILDQDTRAPSCIPYISYSGDSPDRFVGKTTKIFAFYIFTACFVNRKMPVYCIK